MQKAGGEVFQLQSAGDNTVVLCVHSKCRKLGNPEGREGDVPGLEGQERSIGGGCAQESGRTQAALLSGRGE